MSPLELTRFQSQSKRRCATLLSWLLFVLVHCNVVAKDGFIAHYNCKIGCPLTVDPICDTVNHVTYQNDCLAHCQKNLVDIVKPSKGQCDAEVLVFDSRESSGVIMVSPETMQKYQHEGCTFVGFLKVPPSLDPISRSSNNKLKRKKHNDNSENGRLAIPHQSIRLTPEGEIYRCTLEHYSVIVDLQPSVIASSSTVQKHRKLRRNAQEVTNEIPATNTTQVSTNNDDLAPTNIDLESIIGADTRTKVTTLTVAPYDMIGLISNPGCTGSIISKQWVLSAGHCYYDQSLQKYFNSPFATFSPAAYIDGSGNRQFPNGKWQVEYVAVDQRFIQGDTNYDFSLMKIKPNSSNQYIGDVLGSFSLRSIGGTPNCGTFTNSNWRVTGYPSDKGMGDMYDSGACGDWTLSCSKPRLSYTCDTYSGQSGAPIYDKSTNVIYGVHTSGGSTQNQGTFLSDAHLSYIQSITGSTTATSAPTSTSTPRSNGSSEGSSASSTSTVQLTESFTHVGGGVLFAVKAKANIQVIQLAVYIQSSSGITITVYSKDGTFDGYETSTSGWTKVLTVNVDGKGGRTPIYLPSFSSPLSISSGSTRSFLIKASSNVIFYEKVSGSQGDFLKSNSDLVLYKGAATVSSSVFSPRVWYGRVKYKVTSNEAAYMPNTTLAGGSTVAPIGQSDGAAKNNSVATPSNGCDNSTAVENISVPPTVIGSGTITTVENESVSIPLMDLDLPDSVSLVITSSLASEETATPKLFSGSSSQIIVRLSIQTDKYGSETSWKIFKVEDEKAVVYQSSQQYGNSQLYTHELTIDSNSCYTLLVSDSYGDGQCCQYGNGFYSLSDSNGGVLISGSVYRHKQESTFGKC